MQHKFRSKSVKYLAKPFPSQKKESHAPTTFGFPLKQKKEHNSKTMLFHSAVETMNLNYEFKYPRGLSLAIFKSS
jgi:hypothetical protein